MKHNFSDLLYHQAQTFLGLHLTDKARGQAETFYNLVMEWNQMMNLTAITEVTEVVDKHFIDSFLFAPFIPQGDKISLVDVGSGAGFPGIPLAILRPDIEVTCVDSLKKRIGFLEKVVQECGLDHVQPLHGRTEDLVKDPAHRDAYDFATARAVARLPVLLEYAMPFVKVGGKLIAGKGPDLKEEILASGPASQALGARLVTTSETSLPRGDLRYFALFEKTEATPKRFPRKPGEAKRKPIL